MSQVASRAQGAAPSTRCEAGAAVSRASARKPIFSKRALTGCSVLTLTTPWVSAALALTALAGWRLDIEPMRALVPGLTPMNPLTALCFLALSVAMVALCARFRLAAGLLGVAVVATAAWRAVTYALGAPFELDRLLFAQLLDLGIIPSRMASETSIALALLGCSVTLHARGGRTTIYIAQMCSGVASAVGMVMLVVYAYNLTPITHSAHHEPMALNTSLLVTLCGAAVTVSRPYRGFVACLVAAHGAGRSARNLMTTSALLPPAIGLIGIEAQRVGRLDPEAAAALVATFTSVFLGALVWWESRAISRRDRVRRALEAEVVRLNERVMAENESLEARVAERTRSLERSQRELLERLGRAASFKDRDTSRHNERMARYCETIARGLGLPEHECALLAQASRFHDLGKLGIPDAVLNKPGELSDEEQTAMRAHTLVGAELLSGGQSEIVVAAETIALTHHERWDGSGYPEGLRGERIPLYGRIAAVADVLDALASERPYKSAWGLERALEEVRAQAGRQFDPVVVGALLREARTIERVHAEFSAPADGAECAVSEA